MSAKDDALSAAVISEALWLNDMADRTPGEFINQLAMFLLAVRKLADHRS